MLKIKDNVDLKELEKFGFKYEEDWDDDGKLTLYKKGGIMIFIYPDENRKLDECGFGFNNYDVDTIYDLIKADLVEKIDNE